MKQTIEEAAKKYLTDKYGADFNDNSGLIRGANFFSGIAKDMVEFHNQQKEKCKDVNIEEAALSLYPIRECYYGDRLIDDNYISRKQWLKGATWQKEQLQPLVDSHSEMLEALKAMNLQLMQWSHQEIGTNGYNWGNNALAAIEKAQSIINK